MYDLVIVHSLIEENTVHSDHTRVSSCVLVGTRTVGAVPMVCGVRAICFLGPSSVVCVTDVRTCIHGAPHPYVKSRVPPRSLHGSLSHARRLNAPITKETKLHEQQTEPSMRTSYSHRAVHDGHRPTTRPVDRARREPSARRANPTPSSTRSKHDCTCAITAVEYACA